MDGLISARRRRVGTRRCRALGSSTSLTIVITNNPRTTYTATIDGRAVAKGRHTIRHAALRDCFRHPGNANRTSGSRHLWRYTDRKRLVQETCRTWCKWRQQEETTAMLVPCLNTTKRLLFMAGYLIDCGSVVSVLPPTSEGKRNPRPTEHNLSSASGQRLRTFGHRRTSFKLFDQTCSHNMIVADVVHPILGMDFSKMAMESVL